MTSLHQVYVLVVDDNPDARDIMRIGLAHEGANVYVASSAPDALFMLSAILPDVIVTDLTMPPMDGYEFVTELKGSPVWRHIPVIAVTGCAGFHQEKRVRTAGFADYLLKPLDTSALAAAIVRVLPRRAAS